MNYKEKIDAICQHLGINDLFNEKTIIDQLYSTVLKLRKISEFNSMIIHEMIKADLIPPTILKKTELTCSIKNSEEKLTKFSDQLSLYKDNKANDAILKKIAKKMVEIEKDIRTKEKELTALEN